MVSIFSSSHGAGADVAGHVGDASPQLHRVRLAGVGGGQGWRQLKDLVPL